MSAPIYPPVGMVQNPELASIRSLLNASKIIALIFWILGILWVLAVVVGIAAAAAFGAGFFVVGSIFYPVIFTVLNLIAWMQIPSIENHVTAGQYNAARDKSLLWGILEIIGGLVVGILLLVAWSKFDSMMRWQPSMAAGMAPAAWGAPPAYAAQPYAPAGTFAAPVATAPSPAPMAAAPAVATAPPTAPCPRCGGTATWIAQYNRWYCYTCQQYL
ncbi:MAG: hypothetical protein ACREDK_04080 [Thermoplasmata archaeon]